MLQPEEGSPEGSFFQDETKLELNPRVGFCWMRKGKQRRLRTPGTNQKVWISGTLNFSTGRFYWVSGPNKNSELFLKLLKKKLRSTSLAAQSGCGCILCRRALRSQTRWS